MQVALRSELQKFIDAKVRSGAYGSADEVVESALARWKAEEEVDPAELKRLVAEGQAEADRGELHDSEEVFDEIKAESERRRGNRA
jgi:putative addiction module CopG family antidote